MKTQKIASLLLDGINVSSLVFLLLFVGNTAQAQVSWEKYNGTVPASAISGGNENGKRLYVCRCEYNGAWHPGKIIAGNCNIGWGGEEIYIKEGYDVLVKSARNVSIEWVEVTNNQIPDNAVVSGVENDQNLYVGRARYTDGNNHPGKVFKADGQYICNFGYGGKEIVNRSGFEVLTVK